MRELSQPNTSSGHIKPLQVKMSEIAEYQSQLDGVEELLKESPQDESLLKLKSDLLELISLVSGADDTGEGATELEVPLDTAIEEGKGSGKGDTKEEIRVEESDNEHSGKSPSIAAEQTTSSSTTAALPKEQPSNGTSDPSKSAKAKKKSSKIVTKPFEIPAHLLPLDSDTDAERKRKRRTIKALKSQHRSNVKSYESEKKQQSWLDFSKKKKKKKDSSIFATGEGLGAKVGVISGGGKRASESGNGKKQKRGRHKF